MTMKFATYAKIMKEAAGDPPAPPAGAMPPAGAPPAGGMPGDPAAAAGAPPAGGMPPPPMGGGGGDPAAGGMPPMPGDPAAAGGTAKPVNVKTHNVWDVLKKYLHKLKSGDDSDDKKKKADQNV